MFTHIWQMITPFEFWSLLGIVALLGFIWGVLIGASFR